MLRVVRELLHTKPKEKGTSIKNAIDYILKMVKRKSVIFLISDFIDVNYWQELKVLNKKHDLIGIKLFDPAEFNFPNLGLVKVEDPENNESFWIDTSSDNLRLEQKNNLGVRENKFKSDAKRIGLDTISINIQEDYVKPLVSFFKMRGKRRN